MTAYCDNRNFQSSIRLRLSTISFIKDICENRTMDVIDGKWIRARLTNQRGEKARLAEAMGVKPDVVTKILNGIRNVQPAEVPSVIAFFENSSKEQLVAVPGFVGAGAEVDLSDPYPKGEGMYKVVCPQMLDPHSVVAVEVRGESMEPVFSEGDLLFYTRNGAHGVPTEAIGRKCVAETEDGKVWVKQLKIGTAPGLFNLLSINPAATNMLDVRVKWAAPVRLHLPKEFVKRIE